jgi:hypothetical protein
LYSDLPPFLITFFWEILIYEILIAGPRLIRRQQKKIQMKPRRQYVPLTGPTCRCPRAANRCRTKRAPASNCSGNRGGHHTQKSYLARVRCYTIAANGTRIMRREGTNLISSRPTSSSSSDRGEERGEGEERGLRLEGAHRWVMGGGRRRVTTARWAVPEASRLLGFWFRVWGLGELPWSPDLERWLGGSRTGGGTVRGWHVFAFWLLYCCLIHQFSVKWRCHFAVYASLCSRESSWSILDPKHHRHYWGGGAISSWRCCCCGGGARGRGPCRSLLDLLIYPSMQSICRTYSLLCLLSKVFHHLKF